MLKRATKCKRTHLSVLSKSMKRPSSVSICIDHMTRPRPALHPVLPGQRQAGFPGSSSELGWAEGVQISVLFCAYCVT